MSVRFEGGHAVVDARELVALASAVVHADEALSPGGHAVDVDAFRTTFEAAEPLLQELSRLALLPVKRSE